jgi:DHA1 family bicyclomycin/chloramphenicol resistance-like MFS transporter
MVRDTAEPQTAASRLALLNLMVSAEPGLSPAVGGALVALFDWRAIFGLLAAVGLGLLLLCWRRLPETGQMRAGIRAGHVARDYLRLLRSPAFLGYTLGGACTTTSMYGFISASPFIFVNELHRPVQEVGLYLAVMVLGLSAGSLVASRLVRRSGIDRVMLGSSLAGLLGACLFLGVVLSGHMSVALIMPPLILFTFGSGMASPMALTRAISVNPTVIGSAAGLYGCAQMGWGALCSALVAIGGDPAVGAGLVLVGGCAIGQFGFWIAGRSRRAAASREADAR